jgi:DNA repair exonuclease SbcCD ATPase subunit
MKDIRLINLKLENFKGIKRFELVADGNNIEICGANATGKTTVFDAFIWLLFDKDSHYRATSSFGIKTFDRQGNVITGLDHSVEAEIDIGTRTITLRKIYREKWTKKRGEADRTLTGHETEHYINEVPVKKSEYDAYISDIVAEDIFKLITNTLYFNSSQMHWTDRRKLLLSMTGDIEDVDVLNANNELHPLLDIIRQRSLEDHSKIIAGQKKKYNNELRTIPIRIDEINRNLPELPENVDFKKLEQDKLLYERKIEEIDDRINSQEEISQQFKEKSKSLATLKNQIFDLKMQLITQQMTKHNGIEKELHDAKHRKELLTSEIKQDEARTTYFQAEIVKFEESIKELRMQWDFEFRKEFIKPDKGNFVCPTCRQSLPEGEVDSQIAGMLANYKNNKKKVLADINNLGKYKKDTKAKFESELKEVTDRLAKNQNDLEKLMSIISRLDTELTAEKQISDSFHPELDQEYAKMKERIIELENELESLNSGNAVQKLIEDKRTFNRVLNEINKALNSKEIIRESLRRIEALKEEERRYTDMILRLDQEEYLIGQFVITKVNLLEEKINQRFKLVKFKLFNRLVNGAIEECFETMVGGVPYTDLNTAASINAGIDIINSLTEHYNVRAPIFVDNNESVNELLPTQSQVIGLYVTEDPKLCVMTGKFKKNTKTKFQSELMSTADRLDPELTAKYKVS